MTLRGANERFLVKNSNPVWSDEKIEELKVLLDRNLSASAIAKRLGFKTRNSVIGKVTRLGLRLSGQINQTGRPKRSPEGGHLTPRRRLRIVLKAPVIDEEPEADIAGVHDFDLNIPLTQRLKLSQLNGHTCRWPVGDPGTPDFFFCGGYTSTIYCKHHTRRAIRG